MKVLLTLIYVTLGLYESLSAPSGQGLSYMNQQAREKVLERQRLKYMEQANNNFLHEAEHKAPPRKIELMGEDMDTDDDSNLLRPPSAALRAHLKNMEEEIKNRRNAKKLRDMLLGQQTEDVTNDEDDDDDDDVTKRWLDTIYPSYGHDPDMLMTYLPSMSYPNTPREGKLRDGEATDTWSCDYVRDVPAELRDENYFFNPISDFYTQYTEAFGIPIVGSQYVTVEGLKRACYEVRFLFAHRFDIKNHIRSLYGRYSLIADIEEQTSLPEYSNWPATWNDRVRGLGPALHIPVTSAGDDNQRCYVNDRYHNQDILAHEAGHSLHQLGAEYCIPGFGIRLREIFQNAVNSGKYPNSYAQTNKDEYLGVGFQLYLNSFKGPGYEYPGAGPDGDDLKIRDRESLQWYDRDLTDLLDETMPCKNQFVNRCTWKACTLDNFHLACDMSYNAKSKCPIKAVSYTQENATMCAQYTCYMLGNAFNYKPGKCQALQCNDSITELYDHLQIKQGGASFNVYKILDIPEMNMEAENTEPMKKHCSANIVSVKTDPTTYKDKRCDVADKKPYGPTPYSDSGKKCRKRGGCYNNVDGCYYPEQSCADRSPYCPMWAATDHNGIDACHYNPAMMLRICPNSCNACDYAYRIQKVSILAEGLCQDYLGDEIDPVSCSDYGTSYWHKLTCGVCYLDPDWKDILDIPDFV